MKGKAENSVPLRRPGKARKKGPGVDGGSPVTQPCVVVADVVDEHVLVGLGGQDVPVVGVVQERVVVVLQLGRGTRHLGKNLSCE